MSTGASEGRPGEPSEGPPEGPSAGASEGPGGPSGRAGAEPVASVLDTLRVGTLLLDYHGNVLLWSPLAEEMLGWAVDEVVGHRMSEFLRRDEAEHTTNDARRRSLRESGRWRGLLHFRHRDGHWVEVEMLASFLYAGGRDAVQLANIIETSRLRTVEADLAALDSVFSSSPLGIAVFDTDKRYVRLNEALARLNGIPLEDHLGRTVEEVLPPWMSDELSVVQDAVLETGRSVIDVVIPAPDGTGSRSVSYSRLVDHSGDVVGFTTVVMDITERREALQKIEQARQRLTLLDDVGVALADRFEVRAICRALASALVPRYADYAVVHIIAPVVHGDELPETGPAPGMPLIPLGGAARGSGPVVDRLLGVGQEVRLRPDSFYGRVLASGGPQHLSSAEELTALARPDDPRMQAALELGVHSLVAVPLRARGVVLGLLVVSRSGSRPAFDGDDLALAGELAGRAGVSLDNARLYARERAGALMLQRSLLPQRVPEPPGVRIAYRYVPGTSGTEVGGDWFDVIPLPGGRVALVVGDVVGHGLHAAVTMGRLRTAVRTLAGLDLPPEELLRRVDDLAQDIPHEQEDSLLATCVYAVYDPSVRSCTLATAGHPPPLLLLRTAEGGWRARQLDVPPGPPLGVGSVGAGSGVGGYIGGVAGSGGVGRVTFEPADFEVAEGSVLALYTDGLIETREADITAGIDHLRTLLTRGPGDAYETADGACDEIIADLDRRTGARPDDDVAVLMAELGDLPAGSAASWTFGDDEYAVRSARRAVQRTLRHWHLESLEETAVLLVSELVTNSVRHACGPVGVRVVRGNSLLVEVSDPLPDPPRERSATPEDEGGRGVRLVARQARRWGTRYGAMGKTVWFELPLPAGTEP